MNREMHWRSKNEEFWAGERKFAQARPKLYKGPEKTQVTLDEISCSEIRKEIEFCSGKLADFTAIANKLLPENAQFEPANATLEIVRTYSERGAYENDGNTSCEGFRYDAYWTYPLGEHREEELKGALNPAWRVRSGMAEKCLYFHYENGERIHDKEARGSRFFSMHFAGLEKPGERNEKKNSRIDYENNNYKLGSILNGSNLAQLVLRAKRENEYIQTLNAVRKELAAINANEEE